MRAKTEQLQIRVTSQQKVDLKRLARAAGVDVSAYVLARVVPGNRSPLSSALDSLSSTIDQRYALAEINDLLHSTTANEFDSAASTASVAGLSPFLQNYVAAMVEQAAQMKSVAPPAWTRDVAPLETPWFATRMAGLRVHLLRSAPAAFKRRNLFVDASIGARV